MWIKNIILFMTIQCLIGFLSTHATEYNHKLLDIRADTFNQRVWATSEFIITPEEIEESLDFLNGPNKSKEPMEDFSLLCEQCEQTMIRLKANDFGNHAANNFKALIEACQDVYNRGEEAKKAGVSMLLETVLSKSSPNIRRIERLLKKGSSLQANALPSKNLDYFLHADRSQPLVNSELGVF